MSAAGGAGAGLGIASGGAGAVASLGASIAMDEINRAIAFAGQAGAIGVSGLMETFLPAGSELAGGGWFSRILGGIAGAKPQLPNTAGQPVAAPGAQGAGGAQPQGPAAPQVNVNYTNNQATEDRAGADLTRHLTSMNSGPGW